MKLTTQCKRVWECKISTFSNTQLHPPLWPNSQQSIIYGQCWQRDVARRIMMKTHCSRTDEALSGVSGTDWAQSHGGYCYTGALSEWERESLKQHYAQSQPHPFIMAHSDDIIPTGMWGVTALLNHCYKPSETPSPLPPSLPEAASRSCSFV